MKINISDDAVDTWHSLLQYGFGGAVLAVFVAPVFWLMVRGSQKREEARAVRDDQEWRDRSERESKIVDALTRSVEQQRMALDQWQRFESEESSTHKALLGGFSAVASSMERVAMRLETIEERIKAKD